MPRKKSAKEFFRRGKEKGSENCTEGIDGSIVHKKPTDKVLGEYRRMRDLWNQYVEDHPDTSPYHLRSLKDFVKDIVFGIDGAEDDPDPAQGTVMVYWKQFMAGWRRENDAIPRNTTLSVTNNKRPRRFGTKNHFVHLGRQLWGNDWVVYDNPATRVYDWADFLSIVCSSARIGEYIESTCRAGSGRGLYYKVNVTFGVFLNEHKNAEFAVQLVRDAKGMTNAPDKRPEHSLYEGLGPMPLICNPMLPILAILIATKAFRDYETIEDLLDIQPSEREMVHLQWKESVCDLPFFKSMSARGAPRKIETATAFSKRLKLLGFRAGYPRPPKFMTSEPRDSIGLLYTLAQRMKHAGQKDPNTYNNHYQPNNSGTDGQGSYFGTEVRSIANDLFRGLTIARNPQLWQSLPAEKQEEFQNSPREGACSPAGTAGSGLNLTFPPCYHRSIFDRVRFLMLERDRLASTLFETATLRSLTGLSALCDMVALCEKDAEVEFRPGLEPGKCCCSNLVP
ncbi:hypothetical protein B0T16DRAFT_431464 [Cercophora newfieldiana]|uniref:Uncharacterized protein n=1 Tax=Cercophora newfieldiana TaxID=92897 RepID=A0AA39XX95_9PEZI|nr:hypothetical protein B0T16DRAFT_431464 [Cercophora newfieldiana]